MINTTTHANPGVSAYTRSHAAFRSFTARLKPVLLTINACATRCIRILALGIQQVVQILGMLLARFPRTTGLLVLGFILLALLHNVPYIGGILTYIAIVLVVAGGIVSLYTDTMDYFNECRLKNSISRTLDSFRNAMNGGDPHANFDGTDNSTDVH
ncbi:MAG: hypothetical protein NTV22_01245 [bacterium]|nr:hypothetical protein [bacterium]